MKEFMFTLKIFPYVLVYKSLILIVLVFCFTCKWSQLFHYIGQMSSLSHAENRSELQLSEWIMDFVMSDVFAYTSTTSRLMFGCRCAAPYLSLTPHISACMSNSSLTPSMVFVWLLGFVCLLFPDGRHRLHLSSFQVPRESFTALAEALILFPLVGLYDRPFIHSNWKQLSLPVWAGGK